MIFLWNTRPVAPWPGGAMPPPPPIVETRRKIVNVVGNCQSCGRGGGRSKMLSSGKFFGLSEKIFGLPEKYCPCPPPPLKHWSHSATAPAPLSTHRTRFGNAAQFLFSLACDLDPVLCFSNIWKLKKNLSYLVFISFQIYSIDETNSKLRVK